MSSYRSLLHIHPPAAEAAEAKGKAVNGRIQVVFPISTPAFKTFHPAVTHRAADAKPARHVEFEPGFGYSNKHRVGPVVVVVKIPVVVKVGHARGATANFKGSGKVYEFMGRHGVSQPKTAVAERQVFVVGIDGAEGFSHAEQAGIELIEYHAAAAAGAKAGLAVGIAEGKNRAAEAARYAGVVEEGFLLLGNERSRDKKEGEKTTRRR